MATITLRSVAGRALTFTEMDNNFSNLNTDKLENLASDTTPQLGGSLDVNGNSIVSVTNGNIAITPNGTGSVVLDGLNWPQADGTTGYVLTTNGSGQLSWSAKNQDTDTTNFNVTDGTTSTNIQDSDTVTFTGGTFMTVTNVAGEFTLDADNTTEFNITDGTTSSLIEENDTISFIGGANMTVTNSPAGTLTFVSDNTTDFNVSDGSTVSGVEETDTVSFIGGTNMTVTNVAGVLTFDAAGGGATSLSGLSDVDLTGNADGYIMVFNSTSGNFEVENFVPGIASVNADTTPVLGGDLDCDGNVVENLELSDYQETVYTAGSTTGTITPDAADGPVHRITLTGNITLNALASPLAGQSLTMIIIQPVAGNYTLTSSMLFAGGNKTLSTDSDATDILTVFYDGSDYYASLANDFI